MCRFSFHISMHDYINKPEIRVTHYLCEYIYLRWTLNFSTVK